MIYTIAPGDTLTSIATNLTIDPSYWKAIAAYNGISDPNTIYAGSQITIPDDWLKTSGATTAGSSNVTDTTYADTTLTDTSGSAIAYPVRPGQSGTDAQAYIAQYTAQASGGSILDKLKTTTIMGVPAIYFVYGGVAWWLYRNFFKK